MRREEHRAQYGRAEADLGDAPCLRQEAIELRRLVAQQLPRDVAAQIFDILGDGSWRAAENSVDVSHVLDVNEAKNQAGEHPGSHQKRG